jgi:hypothetical protein
MKIFLVALTGLCILASSACAVLPELWFPSTMEVAANGLRSIAFVAQVTDISVEAERGLRYSFKGFPVRNPPEFNDRNKLFYWRPEADQGGYYTFTLTAKNPLGQKISRSVDVRVLPAPSLEALPRGWADMKQEARYLAGKDYLPSTNFLEAGIAALPKYEMEITVEDAGGEECVLTYVPGEGREEVNKGERTARIMLGGQYLTEDAVLVRRDLYEDLYNYLGLVFRRIVSVRFYGGYELQSFRLFDRPSLVAAASEEDLYPQEIELYFDDRDYQGAVYSKEDPMLISDSPVIKIELRTPSGLIWRKARLFIGEQEYSAAKGEFSLVVVKPFQDASGFDVNYAMYLLHIPQDKKLPFGEHYVYFDAQNAYGIARTREAYVRVVSIPAQIEGRVMVFPSPFNPVRHGEVKIQYRLTMPTNLEIAVFGVAGSAVLKRRIGAGEEGARKGLNTISWDGNTGTGTRIANGIYTGVIIDRAENRVLERFKISVYQ